MMNVKFTDNSEEVLAAMQEAALRALEKCGMTAEWYAKKLATVDAGLLRKEQSSAALIWHTGKNRFPLALPLPFCKARV